MSDTIRGENETPSPSQSPKGMPPKRDRLTIPAAVALTLLILVFNLLPPLSDGLGLSLYTVLSMAAVGVLFACSDNKWLALLMPLSYFAALLICGNAMNALSSLLAFPGGYALALAIRQKKGKSHAVASMTLLTLAVWILILLIRMIPALPENGSLLTAVRDTLSAFPDGLRAMFLDPLSTVEGTLTDEAKMAYTASIEAMIPLLTVSLPAMAALTMMAVCYLAASVSVLLMKGLCPARLPARPWGIALSAPAAVLYLFAFSAYAFSALFSSKVGVFYALTLNLVLIFLPGFAIVGGKTLLHRLRHSEGGGRRTVFVVFLIFFLVFNFYYLLYLTAIYGAGRTVSQALEKKFRH